MAVFRPAPPFADLRGSIGQTTYGRNGAGLFARARTAPDNTAPSAEQLACRQNMRDVAAGFAALTTSQRQAWRDLATTTRLVNHLGDPYTPSAWILFARKYLFNAFIGTATNTAPPSYTHSEIQPFSYGYIAGVGIGLGPVSQKFGSWTCLFMISHPQSLNRYYYKGPWQPGRDRVQSNAWFATLPQLLWAIGLLTTNKAYFVRSRILNLNGSVSMQQINRITTT